MALSRFGCTLAEAEREHILETLACCEGNRSRAARFFDISLRSLRMKLHHFVQSGSMVPAAAGSCPSKLKLRTMDQRGHGGIGAHTGGGPDG